MKKVINLLLAFVVLGCSPTDFEPKSTLGETAFTGDLYGKVLVLNEGTFNYQNASLGALNLVDTNYESAVFQSIVGNKLGDVAQSMLQVGDLLLIAVNNSNAIEVINLKSSSYIASIKGSFSPRFMHQLNATQVLVTDMYTDYVYTIDLEQFKITDSLYLPGRTESIAQYNNTIFVSRMNKPLSTSHDSKVFVLNELAHQVVDSFSVSVGPVNLQIDEVNELLWVLCDGGVAQAEPVLEAYSLSTYERMHVFTLGSTQNNPSRLTLNTVNQELLWLNNGVEALQLQNISAGISKKIQPKNGSIWYALEFLPQDSLLLLGDAKDYLSNGEVLVFNSNYQNQGSIGVGVIPTDFQKVYIGE